MHSYKITFSGVVNVSAPSMEEAQKRTERLGVCLYRDGTKPTLPKYLDIETFDIDEIEEVEDC